MDLVNSSVRSGAAGFFSSLYDQLCGTIAALTKAPVVVLGRRAKPNAIAIVGAFGTSVRSVDERFALPRIRAGSHPLIYVPDLRSDLDFKNHPILELHPSARSLFALIVDGNSDGQRTILTIFDPCKNLIECPSTLPAIHKLAEIAKGIRNIELVNRDDGNVAETNFGLGRAIKNNSVNRRIAQTAAQQAQPGSFALLHQSAGFSQAPGLDLTAALDLEPLGGFLFKTLINHPVLLKRHDCRYLALRSWRKAIREHQIAALAAIKRTPPDSFVASVANDLVKAAQEIFGLGHIRAIVPVPGGNSGQARALSVRLAEKIGALTGIPMVEALEGQGGNGASTPKKSDRLQPYKTCRPLAVPVLLVDDVASSGRHIELAARALKLQGCSVHAIIWIAGSIADKEYQPHVS